MKPLTQLELEHIVNDLELLCGAFLQELWASTTQLGLGLYKQGKIVWLWFELDPIRPILIQRPSPPGRSKKVTPVLLFLRAHARGRSLSKVEVPKGQGRVLRLFFGLEADACVLEFRAFPHGQNILVRSGASLISWFKTKELPPQQEASDDTPPRTWQHISDEWLARQSKREAPRAADRDVLRELQQRIERKRKALREVEEALAHEGPWAEIGEHLKAFGMTQLKPEWEKRLNTQHSVSQNMQMAFAKAKQTEKKRAGHQDRARILRNELSELEALQTNPDLNTLAEHLNPTPRKPPPQVDRDVKWRTFQSTQGFILHAGKSARDNLALLRSARPWELWLHLRDFPGSHGIIRRDRDQVVPRAQLEELARHLVRHSLSAKTVSGLGGKFDVLVAERRYVRPLKGDQVGRVHYTHEQVFTISLS